MGTARENTSSPRIQGVPEDQPWPPPVAFSPAVAGPSSPTRRGGYPRAAPTGRRPFQPALSYGSAGPQHRGVSSILDPPAGLARTRRILASHGRTAGRGRLACCSSLGKTPVLFCRRCLPVRSSRTSRSRSMMATASRRKATARRAFRTTCDCVVAVTKRCAASSSGRSTTWTEERDGTRRQH